MNETPNQALRRTGLRLSLSFESLGEAKMKRRLIAISAIAVATILLIWAIPVAIGFARSKPLKGSFLIGQCMCGHDMFFLIEEAQAFDYCPGHKEKKLIGPVSRNSDRIKISRAKNTAPDFELKLEHGRYYLKVLSAKDGKWHHVDQVTNLWRLHSAATSPNDTGQIAAGNRYHRP